MEKQLHILFLSSWYPTAEQPFLGNFVKRHAELIAQRHKVTVLHLQAVDSIPASSSTQTGNLKEIFIQYRSSRNPLAKWRNARKSFKQGLSQITDIDLIHGNVILSKGLQFVWAKRHFNKPLIVTEHASYYQKRISEKWSLKDKAILRKVMKATGCVTAVSPFLKNEMKAHFAGKEIQILPNVVDPRIFTFQPKETEQNVRFIHVSTLDERYKNVRGILAACQLLKQEKGSIFNMSIISDEPYQHLQQLAREMEIDDCVSFSGPLDPAQIAHEMQQSTALVLFSNYETFSIVVAEAWATGTPVIATPVGIARELPAAMGIQVEIGNVEALKTAMQQFVDEKVHFDGFQIHENAQSYFPEKVLKSIEKIYDAMI